MIYEINLWFNPGNKYNGVFNINRGEYQIKIPRLYDFETFVTKGVSMNVATTEEFFSSTLDQSAIYVWIPESSDFLFWNTKQAYFTYVMNGDPIRIPQNKVYRCASKWAPSISFRVEV